VQEVRTPAGATQSLAVTDGAAAIISLGGNGTATLERETYLVRPGFIAVLRAPASLELSAGPNGLRWLDVRWPDRALEALGPLTGGLARTRALYGRSSVSLAWRISDELRMGDPLAPWAVDVLANGIVIGLARGARAHPPAPALAMRARKAIERAGYGPVSLTAIARELGCSLEYLGRVFKRTYGMTPSRFAMWRRIERARRMLLADDRAVGEIAAALEFKDSSHLARHFKVWTGSSPSQFRAVHQE
jgi:AraC-like DNA-binding protein